MDRMLWMVYVIEWAGCYGWYTLDQMERMLWMVYVGSNGPDVMDGICRIDKKSDGMDGMDGMMVQCRIK